MTRSERRAVIRGTGSALPSRVLTNADLEKMVDTSDDWITSRTGIRERRIAREDEYMSQFATRAAQEALASAQLSASDIDLIVCATVTPDMPIPATACIVQDNLGAAGAAAFDLAAGCSGFIYALAVAERFVSSGDYRAVLVVGAELQKAGLKTTDVNLFIPHQANRRIIDAVGSRLGLREDQVYINIERVGNTSAASIPVALDEAVRKGLVRVGDNLLFAAFGTGLTWGAAVCKWGW